MGDLSHEVLTQVVHVLSQRTFSWQIQIDNIALIYDTGTRQELHSRFAFTG